MAREDLGHRCADIVRDDAHGTDAERPDQRRQIGRLVGGTECAARLVAVAEAAQVRRDQLETIGESSHCWLPREPELGPAVQQQQRAAASGARDVQPRAVHLQGGMRDHCAPLLVAAVTFFRAQAATCASPLADSASRTGGKPNIRPYSRVNCVTLS